MRVVTASADPEFTPETLRTLAPAIGPVRTPGLHVSDITTAVLTDLDPDVYGKTYAQDDSENWQEMGFLWETVLSSAFAVHATAASAVRFRPGELVKDGIIGSPDGVCLESSGRVVNEEFKATWKSANSFDLDSKKFLYWQLQFKAYAYLLETVYSRVHVLWVNGDYSRYVPDVRVYDIEWTADELETNWRMLVNHARHKGMYP